MAMPFKQGRSDAPPRRCLGRAEIRIAGYYRPPAYRAYAAYQVTRSFGAVAHIGGNIGKPFAVFSYSYPNTCF
jgi:hypothetical protein